MDFYEATINIVSPDPSQLQSEVKNAVKDEGASGIQYEHLRNDFYGNVSYSTLTDESELEDAIETLCQDGILKAETYFEERVGSLGNDTNLVHKQYVEDDEDKEDDEPETITVDPGGDGGTSPGGTTTGGSIGKGSGGTTSPGAAFKCPQCGEELEDTSCECGFEFDASDVVEGSISIEGASTEELLEKFGLEQPDRPTVRPHPAMGSIDADNKPDLIDQIERETQGWDIHEATITVDGVLTGDELSEYGIKADALSQRVSLNETFEITPDEPMTHDSFLALLWDLNVPENASLSVKLQVNKNE